MSKVETSGTWSGISVTPPNLAGISTENVTWGIPVGADKSGYVFAGGTVDVLLDGTEFTLGTITHQNHPIQGMPQSQFEVDLAVRVLFEDQVPHDFSFRFQHNETPNVGPNPEDIVELPTRVSPETVTVNGTPYAVVITGFKQGGQIVTRFISPENGSNSAELVAVLSRVGQPDVHITTVRFKGQVKRTQADEYVEVVNRGTAPADVSGWVLGAGDTGQNITFPAGTVLMPGQRIRVYTNEVHPEWGGFAYGSGRPIWNDQGDTAVLRDTAGNLVSEHRYGSDATKP